jgi:hypothetical protein
MPSRRNHSVTLSRLAYRIEPGCASRTLRAREGGRPKWCFPVPAAVLRELFRAPTRDAENPFPLGRAPRRSLAFSTQPRGRSTPQASGMFDGRVRERTKLRNRQPDSRCGSTALRNSGYRMITPPLPGMSEFPLRRFGQRPTLPKRQTCIALAPGHRPWKHHAWATSPLR